TFYSNTRTNQPLSCMKTFLLLLLACQIAYAQQYQVINQENSAVGYRGLAFINDSSFVVSGSGTTIGLTTNSGKTVSWIPSPHYTGRDFRDIEVFSEKHFVAMAIARPAVLIETKDAGKTWREIYHNDTEGVFLDALFKTKKGEIYAVGDPLISGKPFIIHQ